MLLCGAFLASPLVGFSGREWGLHQWAPRLSLLLVCPAVPAASRLVPCVQLSTDLSGTQWWCKLLCGLWFLFNPGPGQCWGLPAFWWPCARGRSPPLSLFGHCPLQAVTGPRVPGSAQLGYHPCAFCSPCANLQLNCSLCLSKLHFYPSLTCPPPIDLSWWFE